MERPRFRNKLPGRLLDRRGNASDRGMIFVREETEFGLQIRSTFFPLGTEP